MVVTRERISDDLEHDIPQYPLWQILFMFLWPAVWLSFLIYIVGRRFISDGGVTFIHFKACLPALAVPGNFGWRTGIRVRFWAAWEPAASDGLPLDRELPVPDGLPGNGCTGAWLTY